MSEPKITPSNPTEEQEKKTLEAFFADYKKLCEKHGFDIGAKLQITENGIEPKPIIIKLQKK